MDNITTATQSPEQTQFHLVLPQYEEDWSHLSVRSTFKPVIGVLLLNSNSLLKRIKCKSDVFTFNRGSQKTPQQQQQHGREKETEDNQ